MASLVVVGMSSRKLCVFDHIWVRSGGEFVGRRVDMWANTNRVTIKFLRPRQRMNNAFIESFNRNLRD